MTTLKRSDGYIRPYEPECFAMILKGVTIGVVVGAVGGMATGSAAALRMGFRGRDFYLRVLKHMSSGGAHVGLVGGLAQAFRY